MFKMAATKCVAIACALVTNSILVCIEQKFGKIDTTESTKKWNLFSLILLTLSGKDMEKK